jgi:hypothetical protein
MSEDSIEIQFQAVLYETTTPFRYMVELQVCGIRTGIAAYVWGHKRAQRVMQAFLNDGVDLLAKYGKTEYVIQEVRAMRREEAMARVQVGDSVKLLVDIGSIKKGRVCRVVEIVEPTFYVSRGANAWDDDKYPIKVLPVATANDTVPLGPKDALPLMRGEFGPIDEEIDE